MCVSSSLVAVIDESLIPVDPFTKAVSQHLGVLPWSFAFASGGDFACIYGVPDCLNLDLELIGAKEIGYFEEGSPSIISRISGRSLTFDGHRADRTVNFSSEIKATALLITENYVD
jgi:thiamine monophosphate kinase